MRKADEVDVGRDESGRFVSAEQEVKVTGRVRKPVPENANAAVKRHAADYLRQSEAEGAGVVGSGRVSTKASPVPEALRKALPTRRKS
jgi:hypothetical protein